MKIEKNEIVKIHITLYSRQSFKSGRVWWPYKNREQILKMVNYLRGVLPVKEIKVFDENGKIYKRAKKWKVKAIEIDLSKPLIMDHKEEYEKVYRPVDNFLLKNEFPIYNMWGYSPNKTPWQMNGRHAH
jgi:hypothetical protein